MAFHSKSTEDALKVLETSKQGLSSEEAKKRQSKFGSNLLSGSHRRTLLKIFVDQFKNFILILLAFAVVISVFIGQIEDAIAISLALIASVAFGVILEYKADASLHALQKLQAPRTLALRGGKTVSIDSEDLVPGDIIYLEEGEKVPADCRIIQASSLCVNESALTGEAAAVEKTSESVESNAPLSERTSMTFAGTLIVQGSGAAIVVETGDRTELGKIASKLSNIKSEGTVLQKSLDSLGKKISLISVGVILVLFLAGFIQGKGLTELFILGISLIVAAVPEGLLTVLTIILALGTKKMAEAKALVRKISVVETIGGATAIVVDKTGTITGGKMTLTKIYCKETYLSIANFAECTHAIEYASYCNSAKITEKGLSGDEVDKAILFAAKLQGLNIEEIRKAQQLAFYPLDSNRKRMSVLMELDGEKIAIVKGAPEIILSRCKDIETTLGIIPLTRIEQNKVEASLNSLTQDGNRVIALAYRKTSSTQETDMEDKLTFLALLAFSDPPRSETFGTVQQIKKAGIRVMMLTGDNLKTASAIGKEVGLLEEGFEAVEWGQLEKLNDEELKKRLNNIRIIARSTPLSKLKIVEVLIEKGEIVVVTGDGVNDALALKKAQVGVVMGSGTDVSKEAGNLVLLDDNITTLVRAISYGRTVFNNITNFVRFQFTTNVAILGLFILSSFVGLPYLLTSIEILFINFVMDGPPALALGFEKASKGVMDQKPLRTKSILTRETAKSIFLSAVVMMLVTIGVFFIFETYMPELALTAAFSVFVIMQLLNALNCRFSEGHFYAYPGNNKYLLVALAIMLTLVFAIVEVPAFQETFSTVSLGVLGWSIVLPASALILLFEETKKFVVRKRKRTVVE